MMSSRIRSGGCSATFWRASSPSTAVTIFTGRDSRKACSSSTFCGLSSTISTVDCGRNDSLLGGEELVVLVSVMATSDARERGARDGWATIRPAVRGVKPHGATTCTAAISDSRDGYPLVGEPGAEQADEVSSVDCGQVGTDRMNASGVAVDRGAADDGEAAEAVVADFLDQAARRHQSFVEA